MGGVGIAVNTHTHYCFNINPAYKSSGVLVVSIAGSSVIVMMERALSSGEVSASNAKKREVAYATFMKWKSEMDKECQTDVAGLPHGGSTNNQEVRDEASVQDICKVHNGNCLQDKL